MKKLSFFYFIPYDLKYLIGKHKKELIFCSFLFIVGLIIGIIIAASSSSDFSGSFILILSNEFNPFKSLWIYTAILFFSMVLCFLSSWKKPFFIGLAFVIGFIGYIFGRICTFSITENVFWGCVSIVIFVIPNALTILFATFIVLSKMQNYVMCGSLKQNSTQVIWCIKCFALAFGALFVVNVVIGGIINLLVNII